MTPPPKISPATPPYRPVDKLEFSNAPRYYATNSGARLQLTAPKSEKFNAEREQAKVKALYKALKDNDLVGVKDNLTSYNKDIPIDNDGNYPIHLALGNPDIVKYLITKGVRVNVLNDYDYTPLFKIIFSIRTASENMIKSARILLENGAIPDLKPVGYKGSLITGLLLRKKITHTPNTNANINAIISAMKNDVDLRREYNVHTRDPVGGGRRKTRRRRSKRRISRRR